MNASHDLGGRGVLIEMDDVGIIVVVVLVVVVVVGVVVGVVVVVLELEY